MPVPAAPCACQLQWHNHAQAHGSHTHSHGQGRGRGQWVQLPTHTKAYLLAKSEAGGAAAGRWAAAGQAARGALEPEKVCLFCGNPVTED